MYHLYSHNDLDGVGCGIVAKLAFGKEVEVRYNSVNGLNAQVQYFLEKAKRAADTMPYLSRILLSMKKMKRG